MCYVWASLFRPKMPVAPCAECNGWPTGHKCRPTVLDPTAFRCGRMLKVIKRGITD